MIIDFRITKNPMRQLEINGESVDTVGSYKYLGFTIDNKWGPESWGPSYRNVVE